MRSDAAIPAEQLAEVVVAIYADADAVDWLTLTPQDKSAWYTKWISEPKVGGILTRFLTPDAARTWIKDGPMKEYVNANRGIGRYAAFGRTGGTGPSEIARTALGDSARLLPGSEGVKPAHCEAITATGERAYMAWGASTNFKNLVWAALRASVLDGLSSHVIVLEPPGTGTPTTTVKEQDALAARCGVQVHRMTEQFGRRRSIQEGQRR